MIRINGNSENRATSSTARKSAAAPFAPAGESKESARSAPQMSETTPTAVMSALLDLQSDGGGNAKTLVAAQRTLDMLERLQIRLLEGKACQNDIDTLTKAANVRAHAAADPHLQTIYDEIAVRARVELAKLGR